MMRICESTRFQVAHVTRALPPQYIQKLAKQVDSIIMGALECYWGWPEMPTEDHAPRYWLARAIVRGPLRERSIAQMASLLVRYPVWYMFRPWIFAFSELAIRVVRKIVALEWFYKLVMLNIKGVNNPVGDALSRPPLRPVQLNVTEGELQSILTLCDMQIMSHVNN